MTPAAPVSCTLDRSNPFLVEKRHRRRDGNERIIREELHAKMPERRVERGAAARCVREQHRSARKQVSPQRRQTLRRDREAFPPVQVEERIEDKVRIAWLDRAS